MSLRELFTKEIGIVLVEDNSNILEYVGWLESKIQHEEIETEENDNSFEMSMLTLDDKEGVDLFIEACEKRPSFNWVFWWSRYVLQEVIDYINEQELGFRVKRYSCGYQVSPKQNKLLDFKKEL